MCSSETVQDMRGGVLSFVVDIRLGAFEESEVCNALQSKPKSKSDIVFNRTFSKLKILAAGAVVQGLRYRIKLRSVRSTSK